MIVTFDRHALPALACGLARTVTARVQGRVAVTEHVDEHGIDTMRWPVRHSRRTTAPACLKDQRFVAAGEPPVA